MKSVLISDMNSMNAQVAKYTDLSFGMNRTTARFFKIKLNIDERISCIKHLNCETTLGEVSPLIQLYN